MKRKILVAFGMCILLAYVSVPSGTSFAEEQQKTVSIPEAINQIKKTVVFIGGFTRAPDDVPIPSDGILLKDIDPEKIQFQATGFLIQVQGVFHLVTAKHVLKQFIVTESKDGKVVQRLIDDDMFIFFNRKDGKVGFRSIGLVKTTQKVNWIFHDNANVDLGACRRNGRLGFWSAQSGKQKRRSDQFL